MASMVDVKCKQCKNTFQARTADVKRGWGKFCSKKCKARKQEAKTGQYSNYIHGSRSKQYADEYGGIPNFDRHGEYIGFQCTGFSNEEHDCNKDF